MTDSPLAPAPDSAMRIVVVMRHGEAEPCSRAGDIGRELTERGRGDARAAGEWLAGQGVRPDVVLLSPSVRTRQTWAAVHAGGVEAGDVRVDKALYDCGVAEIVETLSTLTDADRVVLVVGHAPAIPGIAASVEAHCDVPASWVPATLGVLTHVGSWGALLEDAALVACHAPS